MPGKGAIRRGKARLQRGQCIRHWPRCFLLSAEFSRLPEPAVAPFWSPPGQPDSQIFHGLPRTRIFEQPIRKGERSVKISDCELCIAALG